MGKKGATVSAEALDFVPWTTDLVPGPHCNCRLVGLIHPFMRGTVATG